MYYNKHSLAKKGAQCLCDPELTNEIMMAGLLCDCDTTVDLSVIKNSAYSKWTLSWKRATI